jgi:peptidoglycan DL-endopeptidase CwlO
MNLTTHNPALLRGILAGALVLSGVSACSRSNRADSGRDTTQSGAAAVTSADTQSSATASQPSAGAATTPSGDTAVTSTGDTTKATAQTRPQHHRSPSWRKSGRDTTANSGVSGYREMGSDTSAVSSDSSVSTATSDSASAEVAGTGAATPLDSAGVTSDYALTADSSTAGYSEMARDTSSAAGQGDTAAVAVTDTTAPAEGGDIRVHADTTTEQAQADTNAVSGDVASQSESERIRPPEDSTEILGNVTSDKDRAEATEAPTDVAGAAAIGQTVTGVDAVAVMTRAGARCVVKNDSNDVGWDMADSPSALNPCGTGTMTLSLVRTGEK